jgi:glucan endo-1,3-alpha-glucosidase
MTKSVLTALLLFVSITVCYAQTAAPSSSDGAQTHYVFAHYMVCYAGYGDNIDAYKDDILAAQHRGVDGFALDCGAWFLEPKYRAHCIDFYEAAKELGTGFKLFLSPDFSGGITEAELTDMINTFRDHPNQLYYHGKPVISSFGGEGHDNQAGQTNLAIIHSLGAVFVPYYYPRPVSSEIPNQAEVDEVFNTFPDLDGYFYFGAAGSGPAIAASSALLAQKWVGAGKIYMAPVTPFYRANGANYRLFDTKGFKGMQDEWLAAIQNHATWVEIVTWNDYNESTYVSPFDTPEVVAPKIPFGVRQPHVAYLDCSRYYIDWFKNGAPPKITQDSLYYFYQLHPKALAATVGDNVTLTGRPRRADDLEDKVYVTLFLTKPATLTITSGSASQDFPVSAGVDDVEMPFQPGAQRFVLTRHGKTVIDKTGEKPIQATDTSSRFNYFAGEAVAP